MGLNDQATASVSHLFEHFFSLQLSVHKKSGLWGSSLVVQRFGVLVFTAKGPVQSMVRELESQKPCGVAKSNFIKR